jgi:hydroxymethylbilane synthase
MNDRPLRLGTRGSALALAQAEAVAGAVKDCGLPEPLIVPIKTSGPHQTGRSSDTKRVAPGGSALESSERPRTTTGGDKARFVREIERALLAGEVDLGVHSAKDLPSEIPEGLEIAGVPTRETSLDSYVGGAASLEEVPEGARIGTSSVRRRAQLLALRPDLEVVELHGNVDTRLRRLGEGDFDGLVLAAAGLRRLSREAEIAFELDADELTPAPGQGALALETRADDFTASTTAQTLTDRDALATLSAERAVVAALEASCNTPLGVFATLDDGQMRVRAFCGLPDGSEWLRDELEADASEPEALGRRLAERMSAAGAGEILRRAEEVAQHETGRSSTIKRVAPGGSALE